MKISDPRASRSRQALLQSGISILTENTGASLTEIAAAAGVGRATLYRHFETREQLIIELANESLAETDRACAFIIEQGLRGRSAIEAIFQAVIPLGNRFHFLLSLWSIVDSDAKIKETYNRQLSALKMRIEEAKSEQSIDSNIPNEWLISFVDNLLYTSWYNVGAGTLTTQQATRLSIRTFFNGVSCPEN